MSTGSSKADRLTVRSRSMSPSALLAAPAPSAARTTCTRRGSRSSVPIQASKRPVRSAAAALGRASRRLTLQGAGRGRRARRRRRGRRSTFTVEVPSISSRPPRPRGSWPSPPGWGRGSPGRSSADLLGRQVDLEVLAEEADVDLVAHAREVALQREAGQAELDVDRGLVRRLHGTLAGDVQGPLHEARRCHHPRRSPAGRSARSPPGRRGRTSSASAAVELWASSCAGVRPSALFSPPPPPPPPPPHAASPTARSATSAMPVSRRTSRAIQAV